MMDIDEDEEISTPITTFTGHDLEAAKAFVQQNLRDGITCPCCGQFCKI